MGEAWSRLQSRLRRRHTEWHMSIVEASDRRSWDSSGSGSERGRVRTVSLEPIMVVEPEDEHGDVIEGYTRM
jgi:hypothetical protein